MNCKYAQESYALETSFRKGRELATAKGAFENSFGHFLSAAPVKFAFIDRCVLMAKKSGLPYNGKEDANPSGAARIRFGQMAAIVCRDCRRRMITRSGCMNDK